MIRLLVLLIIVLVLTVFLSTIFPSCVTGSNCLRHFTPQDSPIHLDTRSLVLSHLREVQELTTTIMTMATLVSSGQSKQLAGMDIGHTEILYLAVARVRAGIDLAALHEDAVRVDDATVSLRMPAVQILDVALDVEKSQILMARRSPLWAPWGMDLQSAAEHHALAEIRELARDSPWVQEAMEAQAVLVLEALLLGLGMKEVLIHWEPSIESPATH